LEGEKEREREKEIEEIEEEIEGRENRTKGNQEVGQNKKKVR
jgi:hypothetical protein